MEFDESWLWNMDRNRAMSKEWMGRFQDVVGLDHSRMKWLILKDILDLDARQLKNLMSVSQAVGNFVETAAKLSLAHVGDADGDMEIFSAGWDEQQAVWTGASPLRELRPLPINIWFSGRSGNIAAAMTWKSFGSLAAVNVKRSRDSARREKIDY